MLTICTVRACAEAVGMYGSPGQLLSAALTTTLRLELQVDSMCRCTDVVMLPCIIVIYSRKTEDLCATDPGNGSRDKGIFTYKERPQAPNRFEL